MEHPDIVETPEHFEILEGRGYFRPVGSVSFDECVEIVRSAIVYARTQSIRELLVNLTALIGYKSPSTVERYIFAETWARESAGKICLAVVAPTEIIDYQKFGVTVAENRGLKTDVFESESEAVAWLDRCRRSS